MIFQGTFHINAPRQGVWDFLVDSQTVSECVRGAGDVSGETYGQYSLLVKSKVAFLPVATRLRVSILESMPPLILKSLFQGTDKRLGTTMKQTNTLELFEPGPSCTDMKYRGEVSFQGKFGTIWQPIIKAKANQFIKEFSQAVKLRIERPRSNSETDQGGANEHL